MWNELAGRHVIEIVLEKFIAAKARVGKPGLIGDGSGRFVSEDDGLGFDAEAMMFLQNIELVNPVAEGIAIGGAARFGIGDEAEGKATLTVVMHGAEPDFVVTFGDGAVVMKLGDVNQVISIHATAA